MQCHNVLNNNYKYMQMEGWGLGLLASNELFACKQANGSSLSKKVNKVKK